MTYQGTWQTLVKNLGFPEDQAKEVEKNYHELYKVSDEYVEQKLIEASKTGYVTTAFGLKVRTPILQQTIRGNSRTPHEADAEARTAGNALGQGYGQLTNRAANEFMQRVRNSAYKEDIRIIAQIHDAIYLIARNEAEIVKFVNDNLIECMAWQELPELGHDTVKLNSELSIHHPNWAHELEIPNNASKEEIIKLCREYKNGN